MIGGNMVASLQVKRKIKNELGEVVNDFQTVQTLTGWLDFTGGNADYKSKYKGKLEETTHVFMCDYTDIPYKAADCRLIVNCEVFDVLLIDNPMNLNKHLEILLKYNEVIK